MQVKNSLLSIIELGGYPDFRPLYKAKGFEAESIGSMRKALKWLKENSPAVIVAEFNLQIDFRDRCSNLDTLMAVVDRMPATKLIVFYEMEQRHKLDEFLEVYKIFEAIAFPVDENKILTAIDRVLQEAA